MRVISDVPDLTAEMPRWRSTSEALIKSASGSMAPALDRLFGPRTAGTIGILMYHRVTPLVPGLPRPTWNVPPDQFRRQLSGLAARGYQAWPLERLLEHHASGKPFPAKTFVITFDDGYENLYHYAAPILKEFRWPATIFLATRYIGSDRPFPFETWPPAGSCEAPRESWRALSFRQCQQMLDEGLVRLGTHTHTHADFRGHPAALLEDLKVSLDLFAERFDQSEVPLAFPYGRKRLGFSGPLLAAAAREAGVNCALTTESELISAGSDRFDWGRFTVTDSDTAATLALKLEGWYATARSVWRRLRRIPRESSPQASFEPQVSHAAL